MKNKIIIITIILSFFFLNGFIFETEKKNIPKFNLQCRVKPGNTIKTGVVEIEISIPNNELLFIKEKNIYKNKFDISIIVNKNDSLIIGKNQIKTIKYNTFEATKSKKQNIIINESFNLTPDKYTVSVVVTDLATQNGR